MPVLLPRLLRIKQVEAAGTLQGLCRSAEKKEVKVEPVTTKKVNSKLLEDQNDPVVYNSHKEVILPISGKIRII